MDITSVRSGAAHTDVTVITPGVTIAAVAPEVTLGIVGAFGLALFNANIVEFVGAMMGIVRTLVVPVHFGTLAKIRGDQIVRIAVAVTMSAGNRVYVVILRSRLRVLRLVTAAPHTGAGVRSSPLVAVELAIFIVGTKALAIVDGLSRSLPDNGPLFAPRIC